MSQREEVFDVTIPAATLQAAGFSADISFSPGEVVAVELVIPDGPAGLCGIALAAAHTQVLPRKIGQFLIGNDEVIKRDLTGYPNAGSWQLLGYNLDVNDHTFEVRFSLDEIVQVIPAALNPVPLTAAVSAGTVPPGSSPPDLTTDVPAPSTPAATASPPVTEPVAPATVPVAAPTVPVEPQTPVPATPTSPPPPASPVAPSTPLPSTPSTPVAPATPATPQTPATSGAGPAGASAGGASTTLAHQRPSAKAKPAVHHATPSKRKAPAAKAKAPAKRSAHPAAGKTKSTPARAGTKAQTGVEAARAWALSKVGQFRETEGQNLGPQLDVLERLVGDKGAPWCAIFATTAAVHGGMDKSGRTDSCGQITAWTQAGTNGFERGIKPLHDARPGDLILWGTEHVGFVYKVNGSHLTIIAGNTSSGRVWWETEASERWTGLARPRYAGVAPDGARVPAKRAAPAKAAPAKHEAPKRTVKHDAKVIGHAAHPAAKAVKHEPAKRAAPAPAKTGQFTAAQLAFFAAVGKAAAAKAPAKRSPAPAAPKRRR